MKKILSISIVLGLLVQGVLYSQQVQTNGPNEGNVLSFAINSSEQVFSGTSPLSDLSPATLASSEVPTIISFSPTSGPVGTSATITGTNFSTTPANNIVYFGAVRAIVTSATSTSLSVTVPTGATYVPITVTVDGLTAYSSAPFVVTFSGGGSITSGTFAPKVDFTTGANPYGIAISDLDGDGKSDFAVVNSNPSGSISVLRNTSSTGSITFASPLDFATGVNSFQVASGDLDGDGKPDLIVTNFSSNTISVFRNTSASGSITFATKVDIAGAGLYGVNAPYGIAISDLDGDGKPDFVVTNSGYPSSSVSIFRNTSSSGSIAFESPIDFATGLYSSGVAVSDIDGDGKPDIAITNAGNNTLSILRNISLPGSITSSSFNAKVDISSGAEPEGIAISDVDGDGKYTIVVGDVDGDGRPDLVVGNAYSNAFTVLRNTTSPGVITTGSFAPKVDFMTGVWPFVVAMGDLDGDGKPDVVAANRTSNTVSVFRNATLSPAATVTSSAATYVSATSAELNGSANPNGSATIAYFEWGTSSALATFSTTTLQSIGSGTDAVLVTANLAGLGAGTTYYYRAVGQNSAGTQRGSILSFTTATLQQQTQLIIGQVGVLVSGAILNQGQGNALTSKLNAAIQQMNKGNLIAAIHQLSAFVNQVEGLMGARKISSADGDVLIVSANAVIRLLSMPALNVAQNLELQEPEIEAPTRFLLEQNYPNPFNPSTMISFSLPSKTYVSLRVFDAMGREMATLVSRELSAGNHTRQWNGTGMPSGIYFYRLKAGDFVQTKKFVLLR
ncbi:MAG: FG-GAP repeat protein [Candidatus Magasanikbacteria bacterium GW2011_GWA2_50_22]|uniref:FG-GAP repeat protein n=1 Tax=Candidatus Magasanikbacteria bacterium GW2011_GWA2_50_22 TaxID=1619043 RepID=A0A0G1WE95_9BACT|nr:MAG: FG-GAP repeat protein [Candidatus Magasanikbacteria bacterium GW2011_GWA2_50_22]